MPISTKNNVLSLLSELKAHTFVFLFEIKSIHFMNLGLNMLFVLVIISIFGFRPYKKKNWVLIPAILEIIYFSP